jgi:hypothetical protein
MSESSPKHIRAQCHRCETVDDRENMIIDREGDDFFIVCKDELLCSLNKGENVEFEDTVRRTQIEEAITRGHAQPLTFSEVGLNDTFIAFPDQCETRTDFLRGSLVFKKMSHKTARCIFNNAESAFPALTKVYKVVL